MSGNAPVYDLIDDLHYSYAPGANPVLNAFSSKLQGVDDMVTNTAAQPYGVFLESSGYGYDDNHACLRGVRQHMISAGSVSAEYNIFNLPTVLSTSNGDRKFEYVYGAGKYSAQLITGNPAINETRHYLGGMEYKDGVLEAYNFGDGRVVWENGVPKFQYRLADHLGNTVVFFEDKNNNGCITTEEEATSPADLEIVQRLLYYPFGMALEGLGAWNARPWQQYRYNGKERDTLTGWYEYGFRWYIDGIGRFTGVDPIADQFAHVSVYNYAENEPVGHIDLWGLQKLKYPLFHKIADQLIGNDNIGKITTATPEWRENNPLTAGVKDGTFLVLSLMGVNMIDNAIAAALDPNEERGAVLRELSPGLFPTRRTFGGRQSTESQTMREAFRKAKEANGIPRSQQPDKTIKPNTPDGKKAGLDDRNVKQHEFTNSTGDKVTIRQDNPAKYGSPDGKGDQGKHFNAGKTGENLSKQHHYYKN